jgi:hypothetical protein
MALEGTLKDFALPDIFQLIGLQKKTGTLVLRNEQDEVTIAFKDGQLVHADSKGRRLEERLGTVLVRSQLITEGQLHDVLEKQKQTLQRLGHIVVNEGLVKKDDLRKALDLQVTQIIYRVFRWEDAYYRFDQEDEIDYDRENFVPIGAESILMEGMRIIDEWPIVEKSVRSMHATYEKVSVNQPIQIEGAQAEPDEDDFDFDLSSGGGARGGGGGEEKIVLSPDEGRVYELLDGKRTVEDVMYLARLSEFDTCKALYDLLSRDLIRERTAATAGSAAAGAVAALPAEASPIVVWVAHALLAALVLAGLRFWPQNPVPFVNGGNAAGVPRTDVQAQSHAAIRSRLERLAYVLESHRLAQGADKYVDHLDDLVDLGHVRSTDLTNPWGRPFDYALVQDGKGFRLQATDPEGRPLPELTVQGGQVAPPAE